MTIDAVLPLTARDAERAELLLDSLQQNFTGLRRLWIICPDAQAAELRERYAQRKLPFDIHVEPELSIVPEFRLKLRLSGWFKQQLIKLAMHQHVAGTLYLTLDADVVCARPVTAEQLLGDGRGACFVFDKPEYAYWYRRVAQVLRLRGGFYRGTHNVTPALLNVQGVAQLRAGIEQRIHAGRLSRGLRGLKQFWFLRRTRRDARFAPWRVFLAAARPWTEYALYYSFLETSGSFDRFHVLAPRCIYDDERSLWHASDGRLPAQWDPAPAFSGAGPPWFLVAQSNTGISVADIRARIDPLLKAQTVAKPDTPAR